MKKALLAIAALCMLHGCNDSSTVREINELNDLKDAKIAICTGTIFDKYTHEFFPDAETQYFSNYADIPIAIEGGLVDATLCDEPLARMLKKARPDLKFLPERLIEEQYAFIFSPENQELCDQFSECIREMKADGTIAELDEKWFMGDESVQTMPEPIKNPKGIIRHISTNTEPYAYLRNGKVVGFEIEIIQRAAAKLGYATESTVAYFNSLLSAVKSGKADIASSCIAITDERKESFAFTEPHYTGGVVVMTRKNNKVVKPGAASPINSIKDLEGKRAACLTGSAFQELTEPLVNNVQYMLYNDNILSLQALRTGKVEACLFDEPVARLYAAKFSDEFYLANTYRLENQVFAVKKGSPLTIGIDIEIMKLKRSGELDEFIAKWCGADESKKELVEWNHRKDFTGKNGTLRFIADPVLEPVCYMGKDGQYMGLDIELMRRIAYEMDMFFDFQPVSFGNLLECIASDKADVAGGALVYTDERKEKVDMTVSYYQGGLSILARKDESEISLSQLHGKKIGVVSGTTSDQIVEKQFPDSKPIFFNAFSDIPIALESGKIDAFINVEHEVRKLAKTNPRIRVLPEKVATYDCAFLFSPKEKELCEEFSLAIRQMKADGTMEKLEHKWILSEDTTQTVTPAIEDAPRGVLRYATSGDIEPFTYIRDGQLVGYDMDVAQNIANRLGYALEPVILNWSGYLDAVVSGMVRFGVGATAVTEERKQKMLFSEPTYTASLVAVVNASSTSKVRESKQALANAWKSLSESFERTFIRESRWKLILEGLKVTIIITLLSTIFGTILAFGVCAMRRSKNRLLLHTAKIYIALMQGMPILVMLMILYYIVFAKANIDAVLVAVTGFSLNFAAYVGEMFRSGLNGIPKGQMDAALSLGFSRMAAFRKVIFPQIILRIMPVYRGEFVSMFKMTSVVGYIAIQDLTKMSDIIRSRTYEAFFPLIATAIIYFVTAHLLAYSLTYLEHRLNPKNSKRK
ncbi:MAG: ABC transporter permease subunit [Bacteroidales bacterium]|nr:ABC transporter permease subunit [Bacteroidales bacterium]